MDPLVHDPVEAAEVTESVAPAELPIGASLRELLNCNDSMLLEATSSHKPGEHAATVLAALRSIESLLRRGSSCWVVLQPLLEHGAGKRRPGSRHARVGALLHWLLRHPDLAPCTCEALCSCLRGAPELNRLKLSAVRSLQIVSTRGRAGRPARSSGWEPAMRAEIVRVLCASATPPVALAAAAGTGTDGGSIVVGSGGGGDDDVCESGGGGSGDAITGAPTQLTAAAADAALSLLTEAADCVVEEGTTPDGCADAGLGGGGGSALLCAVVDEGIALLWRLCRWRRGKIGFMLPVKELV